jgi:MFS family permease
MWGSVGPYRALFAVPGVRKFVVAGFVGRMPMAMTGIGVVLLVSAVTGSYGIAGAALAATAVCYAAVNPVVGRLVDRYGQGRVLAPLVAANAVSVALLVVIARLTPSTWTLLPAAAAVGLTSPSLGAFVRARWSHLVGADRIPVAYALESVVDELIFVVGPVVVSVLATAVHPAAGIATAGALTLTGGLSLAAQRGTEPPPGASAGHGSAVSVPGMRVLIPVFVLTGSVFGALDVSMIAFAQEQGHRPLAGALLAAIAFGSMSSGLWYGTRAWRADLSRRFMAALTLLAAGMIPLHFAGGVWPMTVLALLAGLAISPTAIAGYGLVERLVPSGLRTEGFAWLSTSVGAGVAIGAPAAGRVIDAHGARAALLFPLGATWLSVAVAAAGLRWLRGGAPRVEFGAEDPGSLDGEGE